MCMLAVYTWLHVYMYKYSAYTYDIYRYIENLNGNCNDIVFQFLIILFTDDGAWYGETFEKMYRFMDYSLVGILLVKTQFYNNLSLYY